MEPVPQSAAGRLVTSTHCVAIQGSMHVQSAWVQYRTEPRPDATGVQLAASSSDLSSFNSDGNGGGGASRRSNPTTRAGALAQT